MHLLSFCLPPIEGLIPAAAPSWHDSPFICAIADSERHLGHVIKEEQWHAYDATHASLSSTGFLYLGAYDDLETAKTVVETATNCLGKVRISRASGGYLS
jgi:hypothetical protein